MNQHQDHADQSDQPVSFWKSGGGVALIMLGLVVAFYFIREHWTHLGQTWPYLLLLLCPAMHLFMHGGHHHSDPTRRSRSITRQEDDNGS